MVTKDNKLKTTFKILAVILICFLLTLVTQIGGILVLLTLWVHRHLKVTFKFMSLLLFLGLYLVSTFFLVPFLAPLFGRERVKHTKTIQPSNYMTVILNRNYVRPELNDLLADTEKRLQGTKIKITYLDANFPFINHFPLFPHLSHDDGKKIDLSLIYEEPGGVISEKQKSVSGYGIFEGPKPNEFNQIEKCLKSGYFQYDYPKYVSFGSIHSELVFSTRGTKRLIQAILQTHELGKLFIEPHLKQRLGLKNQKVRYHYSAQLN
jgi:energy-coupling factor transporter transmembrane protein EcfT